MHSTVLSFLLGVPGFALQIYGLVQGSPFWAVLGTVLHVFGLSFYISAKGYHGLWGFWGVVPVVGFFILLMQWPRLSNVISQSSDDAIPLKSEPKGDVATILGGYKLLAALAPFGLVPILFCGYFWGGADLEKNTSASQTDVSEDAGKAPDADNEEEKSADAESSDGTATKGSVPWNDRVQEGMTYQEVTKLSGNKGEEVVFTPTKHGIVRWKTPSGADLFVRFRGDRVVSSSNTGSADGTSTDGASSDGTSTDGTSSDDSLIKDPANTATEDSAASNKLDPKLAELIDSPKDSRSAKNTPKKTPDRTERETAPSTNTPHTAVRLPSFTHEIAEGPRVVHLHNPNPVAVKVGLRLGDAGRDVAVPPNGAVDVRVPDGRYLVHFVKEASPDRVCSAGSLEVGSNTKTLDLELKLPETPGRR